MNTVAAIAVTLFVTVSLPSHVFASDVVRLTDENFLEATAGRNVFINFFAPWSEDSLDLADDWKKLAADWKDHEFAMVADVDCTDPFSETICDEFDITSFPTLFFGDPQSPEEYTGNGLAYEALSMFAKEVFAKPLCSVTHIEFCDAEHKAIIQKIQAMKKPELKAAEESASVRMGLIHDKFEEKLEEINKQYEEATKAYNDEMDQIRDETHYKWVQQVLAKMDLDGAQQEL